MFMYIYFGDDNMIFLEGTEKENAEYVIRLFGSIMFGRL